MLFFMTHTSACVCVCVCVCVCAINVIEDTVDYTGLGSSYMCHPMFWQVLMLSMTI